MTTKIIIEIKGGNVQSVYSSREIEYLIVDFDNIEAGDSIPGMNDFIPIDDLLSQRNMLNYLKILEEKYSEREDLSDN